QGHTLQPTALVNEAFIKLSSGAPIDWQDRTHFFATAARQMRLILIDHARRRRSRTAPDTPITVPDVPYENYMAIDEALHSLEGLDPRTARGVELRVFGGLKETEIAELLGVSLATVKRDWD